MIERQEFTIVGHMSPGADGEIFKKLEGLEISASSTDQVRILLPGGKLMIEVVNVEGVGLAVAIYKEAGPVHEMELGKALVM